MIQLNFSTPTRGGKIKKQVRGAYHNALAVGGVLERRGLAAIRVHVTCSDDRLSPQTSASPISLKAGLGEPLCDSATDWLERRLTLDGIAGISLNVILRDTDGNASTNLTRSP